jgi:Epoxide hydrolase N terminus
MTESTTAGPRPAAPRAAAEDPTIRPFHVSVPEEDLAELRWRVQATRWPEKETVTDQSQGVQLATMQELVRYWGADSDLRRFEARLNALPRFITEIDGLDIHFLHAQSPHEHALPLIITHSWPGSVIELTVLEREGDAHERSFRRPAHPGRPRLRLRRAEPPGGVHRHLHQPLHRHRWTAPARGHRG